MVIEGEEVLIAQKKAEHNLFVTTDKIPEGTLGPPLMEQDAGTRKESMDI